MIISQIVAVSKNFVIGNEGKIPWHSSADFKFFKKTTMGKPIIMGRKTFDSIGKPLPGRLNIVVTRTPTNFKGPDSVVAVNSVSTAIEYASNKETTEIFIIGGATIYEQTQNITDKLYLTIVDTQAHGDAHFDPNFLKEFQLIETTHHRESTPHLTWHIYSKLLS